MVQKIFYHESVKTRKTLKFESDPKGIAPHSTGQASISAKKTVFVQALGK